MAGRHFAWSIVALVTGIALSVAVLMSTDLSAVQQIALLLGIAAISAALVGLIRFLISRESQRVARTMLEALPNPVYVKGTDGRYSGVNSAWEAFFRTAQRGNRREPHRSSRLDERAIIDDWTLRSEGAAAHRFPRL